MTQKGKECKEVTKLNNNNRKSLEKEKEKNTTVFKTMYTYSKVMVNMNNLFKLARSSLLFC